MNTDGERKVITVVTSLGLRHNEAKFAFITEVVSE